MKNLANTKIFPAFGLFAGLWLSPMGRAGPPAVQDPKPAVPAAPAEPASREWVDFVDGMQVRRTVAPPDAQLDAPPTKMGDVCEVQFFAFTLAPDGVTRLKLLACTGDGAPPLWLVPGEGREPAPLELGLIGLQPGEGRAVRAPAGFWPGAGGPVLVEMQLIDRKPGITLKVLQPPAAKNPVRALRGAAVDIQWSMAVIDNAGNPRPVGAGGDKGAFTVGDGAVIRGLDLGVRGMAAGEVREITVPPHLGYGDRAVGGGIIPAAGTLRIRVEMRQVKEGRL